MPIILPKMVAASNKPQTPPKNVTSTDAPKPFIDKISLIIIPPNEEDAHGIYSAVFTCLDDNTLFAGNVGGPKGGGYKVTRRIALPSIADFKRLPLFQFDYDDKTKLAKRIRLEFVPVDLGPTGIEELHVAVMTFLPDGWEYVVKHSHITRIDVTVDLEGIRMDSFLFLSQQSATTTQWRFKGELQSYYSGKEKGNQTKIYNRKAKRIAKGQAWPGKTVVRIECKLVRFPKLTLPGLFDLKNPFATMTMTANLPQPPEMPPTKTWIWPLFCDAVRCRGLTDALALLRPAQRAKFRKHLKAHPASWWDPDAIWTGWSPMLKELKIAHVNW